MCVAVERTQKKKKITLFQEYIYDTFYELGNVLFRLDRFVLIRFVFFLSMSQ